VSLELAEVRYDDLVVQELTREVQAEYGRRYGGEGDVSPIDPEQFAPPRGRFFLASRDGEPVGMGGWRLGGPQDGDAEIKRMYVRAPRRRRGIARRILDELERSATDAGVRRLVLETGTAQPEAIAMYRAAGFVDIPRFGHYACAPDAVHLGKELGECAADAHDL
jgi:GNAT superfamily N-acetyltransferase